MRRTRLLFRGRSGTSSSGLGGRKETAGLRAGSRPARTRRVGGGFCPRHSRAKQGDEVSASHVDCSRGLDLEHSSGCVLRTLTAPSGRCAGSSTRSRRCAAQPGCVDPLARGKGLGQAGSPGGGPRWRVRRCRLARPRRGGARARDCAGRCGAAGCGRSAADLAACAGGALRGCRAAGQRGAARAPADVVGSRGPLRGGAGARSHPPAAHRHPPLRIR